MSLREIKVQPYIERPLSFEYDALRNELTIEGIRYGGCVFQQLGGPFPKGGAFRLVSRHSDGPLVIERLHGHDKDADPVAQAAIEVREELFRAAVEAEKKRLREPPKTNWQRIADALPFTFTWRKKQ